MAKQAASTLIELLAVIAVARFLAATPKLNNKPKTKQKA
jgi:hypothetical protein